YLSRQLTPALSLTNHVAPSSQSQRTAQYDNNNLPANTKEYHHRHHNRQHSSHHHHSSQSSALMPTNNSNTTTNNSHSNNYNTNPITPIAYPGELKMEGDLVLQALNGFFLILASDGEVFWASQSIETYIGFPQYDVCHNYVFEMVHSEDRDELQRQLTWNHALINAPKTTDRSLTLNEILSSAEHQKLLERNFTLRFRCMLDNTSGFLRLDIRGRLRTVHRHRYGATINEDLPWEPSLALFCVCIPFGPPSIMQMPSKDVIFKSKHRLDMSLITMDARGKQLLDLTDDELSNGTEPVTNNNTTSTSTNGANANRMSVYDLVHYDDLCYLSSAHHELLKTGASGLIAYRMVTRSGKNQWLQTSARLHYKNSKPDHILCTHRPLMDEEGQDLLSKRTMDFKVTYLDGGLSSLNDRILSSY
ncbi:Aryl hydrocarbon receptor, partial [Fragariocoptes setiger]